MSHLLTHAFRYFALCALGLNAACGAEIPAGTDIKVTLRSDGDSQSEDRADERRVTFAELPQESNIKETPVPTKIPTAVPTATGTATPGSGDGDEKGGFGADGSLTCEKYVAQLWKVGSTLNEETPGFIKLKFTSKVLSVEGVNVTVNTKLVTPDSSKNLDETITFDACKQGYRIAVPPTQGACEEKIIGPEDVTVNGTLYHSNKVTFENCTTTAGETYSTVIWRAPDLPLYGIIKRQVTGSVVPSTLGTKISAETKSWTFE